MGCVSGMLAGLGTTFHYMCQTQPWLYALTHSAPLTAEILQSNIWWDIEPISASLFGVPVAFAVTIGVSLLTPAPSREVDELIDFIRIPNLKRNH